MCYDQILIVLKEWQVMQKIECIHVLELFDNYMDMHASPFSKIHVFDFEFPSFI